MPTCKKSVTFTRLKLGKKSSASAERQMNMLWLSLCLSSSWQPAGHITHHYIPAGTGRRRAQMCVAFEGLRAWKMRAFCFQICQSSCSLFRSKTSSCLNAPRLCWSLHLICHLLNVCLTHRHLMWGLDCIHLWLTVSSAVCPSQSAPALIMFAFEMSQMWTSSTARNHSDPAHAFTPHTHASVLYLLSESRRARMHRPSLLYECHFIY